MTPLIKFRAKGVGDTANEWHYGHYHQCADGASYIAGSEDCKDSVCNPDTVGQYVCLNDCNGVEIYEGDILKVDGLLQSPIVTFVDGSFGIYLNGEYVSFRELLADDGTLPFKVVGNVYDNPELPNLSNLLGDEA